jgi:hypothetical protein
VYVEDSQRIVRRRVPDGQRSVVQEFSSLSDMASFTVSVAKNRWYFHHEGTSQFGGSDESVGYADALFSVSKGSGSIARFVWGSVPAEVPLHEPVQVSVSARDSGNRVAASFTGAVELEAIAREGVMSGNLRGDAVPNDQFSNGDFTLGFAFTPHLDLVATHFRHYSGSRVSLWDRTGQLLADQQITAAPGGWTETPLTNSVPLRAGQTYVVGFWNGDAPYYWRSGETPLFEHGAIGGSSYGVGNIFPDNPFPGGWWLVDLRYEAPSSRTIAILPAVPAEFVNGLWQGEIAVLEPGTNIVFRARDVDGHFGESAAFTVPGGDPELRIRFEGNTIVLTGLAPAAGWVLETADHLTPPIPWVPETNAVIELGSRIRITDSGPAGARYYRMRR